MWGSGITRCGDLVRVATSVRRFAPPTWGHSIDGGKVCRRLWNARIHPGLGCRSSLPGHSSPAKDHRRTGSRPSRPMRGEGVARHGVDRARSGLTSRLDAPVMTVPAHRVLPQIRAHHDSEAASRRRPIISPRTRGGGNGACMRSTAGSIDPVRVARVDEETEGRCPSASERAVSARIMNRTGYCSNE
jgi:hypothetical protein